MAVGYDTLWLPIRLTGVGGMLAQAITASKTKSTPVFWWQYSHGHRSLDRVFDAPHSLRLYICLG